SKRSTTTTRTWPRSWRLRVSRRLATRARSAPFGMPTWGEILDELKATPAGPGDVSPLDIVRRKYLKQLRDHTGRNAVLYAVNWTQGGASPALTSINPGDVQGFMEVMHGLSSNQGLDIVLHSPGGSPEATESIVKYVRSKFTDVRVIVPHAAMSAATML